VSTGRDVALPDPAFLAARQVPTCTRCPSAQQRQDEKTSPTRENLNALAVKLGEMQAQLMRLDTIGERLAKIAGSSPRT
jgi:hypothetical protein